MTLSDTDSFSESLKPMTLSTTNQSRPFRTRTAAANMTATIELDDACPDHWSPACDFCLRVLATACRAAGLIMMSPSACALSTLRSPALNLRYREKNAATNVLSFRADLPESLRANLTSEPLGDIVICPVVVETEAREQLKTVEDHWTHMLVHGFYHLIGYDHMTESESATMEALEIECLKKLGISNPYLLV